MTDSYELAEYIYTETTIPAPVRAVWPAFLDMNRWYTDYHWDWISGPPYDGTIEGYKGIGDRGQTHGQRP
jgi:hypothetical protein